MIQSFKMALKSISGNKFRAFLTMLGIIIGVMSLVILVSLVNGVTGEVTNTISNLGSNVVSVSVSDSKGKPITIDTLNEWSKEKEIGYMSPAASESMTVKYSSTSTSATVYGADASYDTIQNIKIMLGRFLKTTDVDNSSFVCVLNYSAATTLFGYADCIGEEISVDGYRFTVVGVLEEEDSSLTRSMKGDSVDIYIPYSVLIRVTDSVSSEISSFYISSAEGYTMDQAETKIESLLMERFNEDDDAFTIITSDALESAMSSITNVLAVLLGSIAAISLIVGGIGIMNIMLVTVTERTREIGIRKAIGAGRGAILMQFLVESVVICMLGCAIGIFFSWGILQIATVIVSSLGLTFKMKLNVVIIAVVFCFAIGVVFGLYPANKAAKLPCIEALHYGG